MGSEVGLVTGNRPLLQQWLPCRPTRSKSWDKGREQSLGTRDPCMNRLQSQPTDSQPQRRGQHARAPGTRGSQIVEPGRLQLFIQGSNGLRPHPRGRHGGAACIPRHYKLRGFPPESLPGCAAGTIEQRWGGSGICGQCEHQYRW